VLFATHGKGYADRGQITKWRPRTNGGSGTAAGKAGIISAEEKVRLCLRGGRTQGPTSPGGSLRTGCPVLSLAPVRLDHPGGDGEQALRIAGNGSVGAAASDFVPGAAPVGLKRDTIFPFLARAKPAPAIRPECFGARRAWSGRRHCLVFSCVEFSETGRFGFRSGLT